MSYVSGDITRNLAAVGGPARSGIGALYMPLARPYDRGTAPAGDAWKLSASGG